MSRPLSRSLPTHDFKWTNENELANWRSCREGIGYILEVDLEYPEDLHDFHNDYTLAPEGMDLHVTPWIYGAQTNSKLDQQK